MQAGPGGAGARNGTWVAIVAAVLVIAGAVVPYISAGGESASLLDSDPSTWLVAILGPAAVAVIAGIAALAGAGSSRGVAGGQGAAGVAVGAAAGAAASVTVIVSVVYEVLSEFDAGSPYAAGFWLHAVAVLVGLGLVYVAWALTAEAKAVESPTMQPLVAAGGAVGLGIFAVGVLMPVDGAGVLDIGQTVTPAYLLYLAVVVVVGAIGFASRRPTGAALGLGVSVSPLCMWLSSVIVDAGEGEGFFAGFQEGAAAVVAIGAIMATACGLIGTLAATTAAVGPGAGTIGGGALAGSFPAGWHPDPLGRYPRRYWDGRSWTAHVADATGAVGTDPVGAAAVVPRESVWTPTMQMPVAASPAVLPSAAVAQPAAAPPAAWYPDPWGRYATRYWDGAAWTAHVADAYGGVASDPLASTGGGGAAAVISGTPAAHAAHAAQASQAAAWYPDPVGRYATRYWDGAAWTAHVADASGAVGYDPI